MGIETARRKRFIKEEHDYRLGVVTMLLLSGAAGSLILTVFLWPERDGAKLTEESTRLPLEASAQIEEAEEHAPLPAVFGLAGSRSASKPGAIRDAAVAPKPQAARPAPAVRVEALAAAPEAPPASSPDAPTAIAGGEAAALWKNPARYVVERSWLRSADTLKAMVRQPDRVERYLDLPAVKLVTNSPMLSRWVLGNRAVVRAFLHSPAMRDRDAVSALLGSRLAERILTAPGVRSLLQDPARISEVFQDPEIVDWLRANPAALSALSPAAGEAGRQ